MQMTNPGEKILSDLYNIKNKNLQQIADIYGVTRECVRQWMKECRLARNKRGRRSSFDESNLKRMYHEYVEGELVSKLLRKYHISSDTFYKLFYKLKGKHFKKMKRFSVPLSEKQCTFIKLLSSMFGISKSQFFGRAIQNYSDWFYSLSEEEKKKHIEEIHTSGLGKLGADDKVAESLIKKLKQIGEKELKQIKKIGGKNARNRY